MKSSASIALSDGAEATLASADGSATTSTADELGAHGVAPVISYDAVAPTTSRSSSLLRTLLAIFSITLSVVLLGALLLLSASGAPETYRTLDQNLRYLTEVTDAAEQGLALAQQPELRSIDLRELGDLSLAGMSRAGAELRKIYEPDDELEHLRSLVIEGFNVLDDVPAPDAGRIMDSYRSLREQLEIFAATIAAFSDNWDRYTTIRALVDNRGRELVQSLRERGRGRAADEVYQGTRLLLERSALGGSMGSIGSVIERLSQPIEGIGLADRDVLVNLLGEAAELDVLRAQMDEQLALMDLAATRGQLDALRERATADYLYVLGTINDARVLLNVYTVLLLIVLAFFGLRLNRSYAALNRSHDDLELRVQERTADLEQALDDLKESQVQLVQAEKMSSLGQLVAGVMHEINTPLLYVLNNTRMSAEMVHGIKDYLDLSAPLVRDVRSDVDVDALQEDIDEVQTLAADSTDGLQQISELVQSLKDFSRLDRVAEERFDVREGIEKTLIITKNLLKYGVEVVRDFQEVPDIFCSPSRLNQVFTNLITNAAQAMDGEGTLRIGTRARNDAWVEIVFEDTGCGIPAEHLTKIMDPFFTTKPVGQGTGLGLSIVRKIVDEHKGYIDIESDEGQGTRITLVFPISRDRLTPSAPDQSEGAQTPRSPVPRRMRRRLPDGSSVGAKGTFYR